MDKFNCEMPGCPNTTTRIPHVCTAHFIEGWGRIKPLPEKPEENPVNDRMAKMREAKRLKAK